MNRITNENESAIDSVKLWLKSELLVKGTDL